jgi:hypothetical protein
LAVLQFALMCWTTACYLAASGSIGHSVAICMLLACLAACGCSMPSFPYIEYSFLGGASLLVLWSG